MFLELHIIPYENKEFGKYIDTMEVGWQDTMFSFTPKVPLILKENPHFKQTEFYLTKLSDDIRAIEDPLPKPIDKETFESYQYLLTLFQTQA